MDAASRRAIARVAAPVVFLLAVTIAVLLVRAGLRDEEQPRPPTRAVVTTTTSELQGRS